MTEKPSLRPGALSLRINESNEPLRLTLGALAAIEEGLGGDLNSVGERLKNPNVTDILLILHALLLGGGSTLTIAALKASDLDLGDAVKAITTAFSGLTVTENQGADPVGKAPAPNKAATLFDGASPLGPNGERPFGRAL